MIDTQKPPNWLVAFKKIVLVLLISVSCGFSMWLIGTVFTNVWDDKNAPWIIGRASGITTYLLLFLLVVSGLLLAHPKRSKLYTIVNTTSRIRLHAAVSLFALSFLVLHIVSLATDSYAGVGWSGALLPFGSQYRPAAVTLGVLGVYSGILVGVSMSLSGRITKRFWWPLHKVAIVVFGLVWVHGIWAGTDTEILRPLYAVTGILIVLLAISRYTTSTVQDKRQIANEKASVKNEKSASLENLHV